MRGLLLLALLGVSPSLRAAAKNPDTYTYLTLSDADSLDPAWAYDAASNSILLNLYDTLFAYEGASTEKLIPLAAEKVPSRANGLLSADGRTYRIPIRKGMRFHDGNPVTPEDARYSLLRFMLQDRNAGPSALLLEPLLGYPATRDERGRPKPTCYRDAARALRLEGSELVLTLPKPYAPLLHVLAAWAPVVPKAWAIRNGGWDGSQASWTRYNDPEKESSPFFERANGSGPFKLERWDRKTKEFVLARNDAYWRGPAKIRRVVVKGVNEFGTRKLMLQAGDADAIYADRSVHSQLTGLPGVELLDGLSSLEMDPVAYFTFKVQASGNPNIGSGRLDGDGIPPDFFSDPDARKGFAYAFDYAGFLRDVLRSKGSQAVGCIPKGLLGHDPAGKKYVLDPLKAAEHLRRSHGGKVWERGFKFTLVYNSGNLPRQSLCQILKRGVESLNPKFRLDVRAVEWPTFLDQHKAGKLPIFALGWQADFPDPHNFVFPMLHSKGTYPASQGYKNEEADRLIERAIAETDPARRAVLYARIQDIEFMDVPHLVLADRARYRTQRDWVEGFIHNPIFPDSPYSAYYYTIYKR